MENFIRILVDNFIQILFVSGYATGKLCFLTSDYSLEMVSGQMLSAFLFVLFLLLILLMVLCGYVRSRLNSRREAKQKENELLQKLDNRLNRRVVADDDELSDFGGEKEDICLPNTVQKKATAVRQSSINFDWDRNTKADTGEIIKSGDAFQYRLKPQKLVNQLGFIIDLLARGVDEPKIAQTVMYKNQHLNSEDDIIQTITAIKFFIYLCMNRRFKKVDTNTMLPQENTAIFHLARGDCSLALVLLEKLIDHNLNRIKTMRNGVERERRFCETSNCATIFGTLAVFENLDLARGAFELAIELNNRNVTAWGRIGDVYTQLEGYDKSVWAYSNVLNLADDGVYTQQIANAEKMLSSFYNENGWREKSSLLADKSNNFYERIEINKPLTEREIKIVKIIESKEYDNMETIVDSLLDCRNAPKTTGYI